MVALDEALGQAVIQPSRCLRHASAGIRSRYLSGLLGSHQGLILNGVAVDQELADAISSSELLSGQTAQVPILLPGAEVDARLDFNDYSFQHSLALSGAVVRQPTTFRDCTFKGSLTAQFTFSMQDHRIS